MSSKNLNHYGSVSTDDYKGSIGGSTNNYKNDDLTSDTYKNYSNQCTLRGAVVFCQHGFLGNEDTMLPLFETLKTKTFKNDNSAYFCNGVLRYSELRAGNATLNEILSTHEQRPEKNIFVRTLFSNPQYGAVTTQAAELKEMIGFVRAKYPNIPVVVIGYSKGGVVNCKCAIDNPGLIDKIINIGTPHEDTLVQDIVQIVGDELEEKFGTFAGIEIKPARDAIQFLVNNINNFVDTVMDGPIIYKKLKSEWNALSKKPKFIPIAGEAIVVNGEFNGDFVVPTESAIAEGFRGRTYLSRIEHFKVKTDRLTISTSQLRAGMGNCAFVLDILATFSDAILKFDVVKTIECLFDIIANIVQNGDNIVDCLDLAHMSMFNNPDFILTHEEIAYYVVEGLNA